MPASAPSVGVEGETGTGKDRQEELTVVEQPFYKMWQLDDTAEVSHGDTRRELQEALELVANDIRAAPTVPGDPNDAEEPDPDALREDAAVELPRKHCAFKGCLWSEADGTDDDLLIASRIPPGHLSIKSEGAMLQVSIRVLEGTLSSRSRMERRFLIPACIRNGS